MIKTAIIIVLRYEWNGEFAMTSQQLTFETEQLAQAVVRKLEHTYNSIPNMRATVTMVPGVA